MLSDKDPASQITLSKRCDNVRILRFNYADL